MEHHHGDRRHAWSLERLLLIGTFVCSVIAFVFTLGVQWAKTTAVEEKVKAVQESSLPRELYNADQKHIADAIDRLTKALDKINEQRDAIRTPIFGSR